MSTYSVRCRNSACRHRRVISKHPDTYRRVPRCPSCGSDLGWRIESRDYNKRNLCYCSGPIGRDAAAFPHRTTHPMCDQNPRGHYNQAKRAGVADDDIPLEYLGQPAGAECPF